MKITFSQYRALLDARHFLWQEAEAWKNQDRETHEAALRRFEDLDALTKELEPLFQKPHQERTFKLLPIE